MAIIVSLVFLLALLVTAYAFYATLVPALPQIEQLMLQTQPAGKPRMIYFGVDRRTVRQMEEAQKLVPLKPRTAAPIIHRSSVQHLNRAA